MAKVLFIGIGKMGFPMAMNLLGAGHEVSVLDKDPAKVEEAVRRGATAARSLDEGMRGADFIFSSVPTSENLVELAAGTGGIAGYIKPGQIAVDMSTVSVASSRICNEAITAAGAAFLRCPANGSTVYAESAQLTIIASGPKDAYDRALPLLAKLSKTQHYIGDADQARLMKLAVNTIIATTLEIFAEAAVLCEKGGIDWNTAMDVFAGSSIASPQLCFKLGPIRRRDFTPASYVTTVVKDSTMAIEAAKELGVYVPVTAATLQMYEACVARGHGGKDFSVVLEAVEAMSGMKSPGV